MPARFSARVPRRLEANRLAAARALNGPVACDLTVSDPTRCDLPYPADLLEPLADSAALQHAPSPRGPLPARRAIAEGYRRFGAEVDADRIVLAASTSEAYSMLFRLLADPGDWILVPAPSYPLFEHLGRLDGVGRRHYRLDPETGWRIDPTSLGAPSDGCRAVVAVHPNNPTGSFVHPGDGELLAEWCRAAGAALIVDEVFLPYPLEAPAAASFAAAPGVLCFALGGISKWLGLPQLKLAWLVVGGADAEVAAALERLDYIADAYLSVGAPVALAAPRLLGAGEAVSRAIAGRCRDNLVALRRLIAAHPAVTVPRVAGGWSAMLRIPAVEDDETVCLRLLGEHGVAVHPGYLFDAPGDGWLVVSLLPPPGPFDDGVRRLLAGLGAMLEP